MSTIHYCQGDEKLQGNHQMQPYSLPDPVGLTTLIEESRRGSTLAEEQLIQLVYPSLKAIAANLLRNERSDRPLQTTELVHEAYLRLFNGVHLPARSRIQFFAIAKRAMRRTLVDCARERLSAKRGGTTPLPIVEELVSDQSARSLLHTIAIGNAVDQLASVDQRAADVVDLHHFCGLEHVEVAQALGVSETTVGNDWRFAKAWLKQALGEAL